MLRYVAMDCNPMNPSRYEPIQSRAHRTRRRVLEAAQKVFIRRGYDAARVEEITRTGQVGYGTFYKYFRDKQDVLEALMGDVYLELSNGKFPERLDPTCLGDQIRDGIHNYLLAFHKHRKILLAVQPACLASLAICKTRMELREKNVLWMTGELKRIGLHEGRVPVNLEILSRAMVQVLESTALDWISHHRHFAIEEVSGTLCEIWLRALTHDRLEDAVARGTKLPVASTVANTARVEPLGLPAEGVLITKNDQEHVYDHGAETHSE